MLKATIIISSYSHCVTAQWLTSLIGTIMLNSRMPKELNIKQETTDTKIDVDGKVTMSHSNTLQ